MVMGRSILIEREWTRLCEDGAVLRSVKTPALKQGGIASFNMMMGWIEGAGDTGTTPESVLKGLKVVLEAGHGWDLDPNFDPGATGHELREFDLNVVMVREVETILKSLGATVSTHVFDRETGPRLSLRQRGELARDAHVFISCHHNSSSVQAQGTETFIHMDAGSEDRELAVLVQRGMVKALGRPDRGVKRAGYTILAGAQGKAAACLIEPFFINGPVKLGPEDTKKAARGVVEGITAYAKGAGIVQG